MILQTKPAKLNRYIDFFQSIKVDIQQTQLRAAISVTRKLTSLYWLESNLFSRQRKTINNFKHTLPTIKDLETEFALSRK